ncbi:MAG: Fur family transcriptional regulator [Vulcanimicrobiaceae bacterium]
MSSHTLRVARAGHPAAPQNPQPVRAVYETSTRRAVLELLKNEQRYLTAAAIFRMLRGRNAKLALSTVYRTLEVLTERGTVSSRTDPSGEASYVFCTDDHHHHAICTACGHVDEVDCDAMDAFRSALLAQQAFVLDEHAIEFFGRCVRCR